MRHSRVEIHGNGRGKVSSMNWIMTDKGFQVAAPAEIFVDLETALATRDATQLKVDLPGDADVTDLRPILPRIATIRIHFAGFSDGRGFSQARLLRLWGYRSRLRASGLIADQYAMARRSGFDAVDVSPSLAARQPETQWLAKADWQANDYQTRLRQKAG
jgi:uncharacterized protein (DUF934 family)